MSAASAQTQSTSAANGNAQKKFRPFFEKGGRSSVEYTGEQAKIKAMVETKNVTWDGGGREPGRHPVGCEACLEKDFDYSKDGQSDFTPAPPW